jgi:hypothetical protein
MKSNGFFLLDLDGTSRNGGEIKRTGSVTAPVVPMFSAVKEFFGEPPEFKSQFALTDGRRVYGYKALPSLDKEYWKVPFLLISSGVIEEGSYPFLRSPYFFATCLILLHR